MHFTAPLALSLLLLLPVMAFLGWPRRGWNYRREIISLVLRTVIMLCLVLSLAGLEINSTAGKGTALGVVFLVDVSDSMPQAARQLAMGYVQQALQNMGPDDEAAVVLFGKDALVERPMSPVRELGRFTSVPETNQTDLEEAIQLALALYPPEKARRMVILSDGSVTTGDALSAAKLAQASGVEIVILPFTHSVGPEAMLSSVEIPGPLRQGDRFNLSLSLDVTQATHAEIRVLSDGQVIYETNAELKRGSQTLSLPLTAANPGFLEYTVQVNPVQDTFYQNNELSAYTQVYGPPRVLLIAPQIGEALNQRGETRPDEVTSLLGALKATGFTIKQALPFDLPADLPELAQYASLVFVDVPARQLTAGQMLAVQAYVRELGGGLVVVGGPTSYGVGGYYHTPLEQVLPVEIQIKDEKRRPSLAIVFIIDHSGSMSETSGGAVKLELAKEAAMRSIELLMPGDRVGVIAFDDAASWVVPMTDLADPQNVINQIATLRPGGGTDILAGLQAMASVLPGETATSRHVILLTDGGADPTGIAELVANLNQQFGITLTTVGVGRDAAPFLPQIAALGGGRYHFAENPASIPSIFTEETSLATRAYLVEEAFTPRLLQDSPILSGIDSMPQLYGYVGTSPKDSAQTIMVTPKDDPLLAIWRYGLGKVVAFTSDATGRWAKDWLTWPGFSTFWAQALRYTIGDPAASTLNLKVQQQGEKARLVVDASEVASGGSQGAFLNGYTIQANIVFPGGVSQEVSLRQIAPGKYAGDFQPGEQGVYLIHLSGQANQANLPALTEIAGWVMSYSPEYKQIQPDTDMLYRLALAVNGKVGTDDPAKIFIHSLRALGASRPAWPWLLVIAAVLLPIDIAVRRLVISKSDLVKSLASLRQGLQKRSAVESIPRSQQMHELMRAKQRAGLERSSSARNSEEPKEQARIVNDETGVDPKARKITRSGGDEERPVDGPPSTSSPIKKDNILGEEQTTTASVLLAKKRASKEQQKKDPGE